jgi:hypothetical protein
MTKEKEMYTNEICNQCGHSIEDHDYSGSISLEDDKFVNFVKCYVQGCDHEFKEYG